MRVVLCYSIKGRDSLIRIAFLVELTGALVENWGCHLVAFLLNELKGQVSLIRTGQSIYYVEYNKMILFKDLEKTVYKN